MSRPLKLAATGRVAAQGSPIRSSRASRWRAAVLIGIHVLVALHISHFYVTGETLSPLEPSEAMEFSKRSVINAGFIFFALAILSTLILGRFFCGWACHLVALQDLALWLLKRVGIKPRPLRSRLLMAVPLCAAFYMFALPLFARWWYGIETSNYVFESKTSTFWNTFPGWTIALLTLVLCSFGSVYFLGAKGFCTYACPYGGIFRLLDRFAPGRIRVNDNCKGCGHCTATCTSNVAVAQEVRDWGHVQDPACMKCLDCVSVCPTQALSFGLTRPAIASSRRPEALPAKSGRKWESWGSELGHAVFFVLTLAAFRGLMVFDDEALPFLFSLALAGVTSVCCMQCVRLFTQASVKQHGLHLKRAGRLTRAGRVLLVAMLPFLFLWSHAGLIRFHDAAATALSEELANLGRERHLWREPWYELNIAALGEEHQEKVRELESHALMIRKWALVEGRRNPQRLLWCAIYSADEQATDHYLEEVLSHASSDAFYLALAGCISQRRGNLEHAEGQFASALRVQPGFSAAAIALAELHTQLNRIDKALGVLDECLALHPGDPVLLIAKATCTYLAGDLVTCEALFRELLEHEPAHALARVGLASVLFRTERPAQADQVLRRGLELAPQSLEMKLLVKGVLLELGRLGDAANLLREACQLAPAREDLRRELKSLEALLNEPSHENSSDDHAQGV